MKQLLYIVVLAFSTIPVSDIHAQPAQERTLQKDENRTKKILIISGLAVQQAASFYVEYKWWWEGNYHPFVIYSDGWFNNYSLGIDKVGHFYTSYFYFHAINEVFRWGGFSERTRTLASVAIPFFYALSIELGDGFSDYNFSVQDLEINTLGICYGLLQDKVPFMQNFNVKFSYFPSRRQFDKNFKDWSLTEDYDGHIYWLTMNMHHILPSRAKKVWPEFLAVAVGYGVDGFEPKPPNLRREFFIGFDYNLGAIKTKSSTAKMIINILDKFHYPAPGYKKTGTEDMVPQWLLLN